jgi:small-conductance mechanosensitive channel
MDKLMTGVGSPDDMLAWLVPTLIAASGVLLGILVDKFVLGHFAEKAKNTDWEGDDIIFGALHGHTTLWFTLAGAYAALAFLGLNDRAQSLIENLLLLAFIASVTACLAKMASDFTGIYASRISGVLPSTSLFKHLVSMAIWLVGILIALQSLGISITPLLTALGVGGLAVALALQDTLSNLFAAIQMLMSRQVKPGDYVRIESGQEGYVTDINWRNTTMRQLPNNIVIVPNTKMASAIVINFNQPDKELAVTVDVGVSYDSDLAKVEKVAMETAKEVMAEVPGGVKGFEPVIRFHTFGDSSINLTIALRAGEFSDQYLIKHEFVKRLHARFKKENIDIPYPTRTVKLEK